jgi:hypothetical protein
MMVLSQGLEQDGFVDEGHVGKESGLPRWQGRNAVGPT